MIAIPIGIVFLALCFAAVWGWTYHMTQITDLDEECGNLTARIQRLEKLEQEHHAPTRNRPS